LLTATERERASYRIVPKGGGYRENDCTGPLSLDPEHAVHIVAAARERSRALMAEREHEIEIYNW
jgi:hypothetical protein